MYESSFGMTGPPFQLSPDPDFYFDSRTHHRALAELRRGLGEEAGFIVVSGEIGAGKTTLIRTLVGELDPTLLAVAHVVNTQLDADELLDAVAIGFGIALEGARPKEVASRLLRFLVKLDKQSRRAVLIIDEAQNLQRAAFERLLALATYRSPRRLPLQICLVGQPELRMMIVTPGLAPLRRLVGVSSHLGPLDREETGAYIVHRLRKVGWSDRPRFEPGAFDEIFRWTRGIPRRINVLCNRLMLSRFVASEPSVDVATVAHVARELRAEVGETGAEPPPLLPIKGLAEAGPLRSPDFETRLPALPPVSGPSHPLLCIVADCGDHIKAAALMRALAENPDAPAATLVRVHDNEALALSSALFAGLDIGKRLIALDVADATQDLQMSELTRTFGLLLEGVLPRAVIVFDGSDAALACATVARARAVPIVHIGAGLRVSDAFLAARSARKPTDDLADLLYTTDARASLTLVEEGLPPERIHCVGNLLIDALQMALRAPASSTVSRVGAATVQSFLGNHRGYALAVLNKPVNIGDRESLMGMLAILREISRDIPLVWPMQGAIESQMRKHRLEGSIFGDQICRLPPQPYVDYVALLRNATCVLTDSWNAQEEATTLCVPCLTIGAYPEHPVTASIGSNVGVGRSRALATRALWECLFNGGKRGRVPDLWDGKAGARIAGYLSAWLQETPPIPRVPGHGDGRPESPAI